MTIPLACYRQWRKNARAGRLKIPIQRKQGIFDLQGQYLGKGSPMVSGTFRRMKERE